MTYRYALDQTKSSNECLDFLYEKAVKYKCTTFGYYKGNNKTTCILEAMHEVNRSEVTLKRNRNV